MNVYTRIQILSSVLALTLAGFLGVVTSGCRGGTGSECVADSDCELGDLCLKRTQVIEGERYEELWGTCHVDDDDDLIPNDGDLSGSSLDRRCGVHVTSDPETGVQTVFEKVIGDCDDNCPDVSNARFSRRFVCMAKDDCCPASESAKEKATKFDRCADITDQTDTCSSCFSGENPTPKICYLGSSDGFDLDSRGCVHCRPLEEKIACATTADCNSAITAGRLPKPACSGKWQCTVNMADGTKSGFCKFFPKLVEMEDDDGYSQLWQLDSDWDGLGDECDNCPQSPNGLECKNPIFQLRCDVNQDGLITPAELMLGEQANRDGDRYGDACDLCPDLSDNDNGDLDHDGIGNPCDNDDDGDGVCDPGIVADDCHGSDNCPEIWNSSQHDMDHDGKGDECDSDADGDGVREDGDGSGVAGDNPCVGGNRRNCDDNCPGVRNSSQADENNNGIGDDCE